jgi:hypothetical protein
VSEAKCIDRCVMEEIDLFCTEELESKEHRGLGRGLVKLVKETRSEAQPILGKQRMV